MAIMMVMMVMTATMVVTGMTAVMTATMVATGTTAVMTATMVATGMTAAMTGMMVATTMAVATVAAAADAISAGRVASSPAPADSGCDQPSARNRAFQASRVSSQ
jgi:hypothetical protein